VKIKLIQRWESLYKADQYAQVHPRTLIKPEGMWGVCKFIYLCKLRTFNGRSGMFPLEN